jgi:UDP-N-acetylglucosamine diphosphorylase/glucosamine-1-phosphate N-acetyltransferase
MNLILFDDPVIQMDLLPFTFTRPVAKVRVGILAIDEKWEKWLGVKPSFQTRDYLKGKYPSTLSDHNLLINGALCPESKLVEAIRNLPKGSFLVKDQLLLAANHPEGQITQQNTVQFSDNITLINKPWKIFSENGKQIRADFDIITKGRKSEPVNDPHTIVYGKENLFIESGVDIKAAIINAESGPVYLGKNSAVQEGSMIKGPFALCEGSHVNMGGKMRGDVTVGPFSKVGGEISTSVIFGYSNKAHDGFLGCSVLGEWCNLGADTNTSNLKNNYADVKIWRHASGSFETTGMQFCGMMMGDHSKSGINTMFNTGTVVDVSANVYGEGFPRTYIPSFAWGGSSGFMTYQLNKALETAERAMARRNMPLEQVDKDILKSVFEITAGTRVWDKKS